MADIKVNIDGQELLAQPGQTVLEAALDHGIDIPNLCHDSRLAPTGACRLCLVRIEGVPKLQTACTTPVKQDMVVSTEDEEIAAIRKTSLQFLLSEHRVACTTCDVNGQCKLQDYAYLYQVDEKAYGLAERKRTEPVFTSTSKALDYDATKCILCGRCVRICNEVQMAHALTFAQRAAQLEIGTAFNIPVQESTCVTCGQCVSTCPTDAIYEKSSRGKGRRADVDVVRTTCPYCGVGCRLDLWVDRSRNELVRVCSETGVVPNDGNLCIKGRFGLDFVSDPRRLTTPLIRQDGELQEASWEEALGLVAERLGEIREQSGPQSIAGLSSAKCTNEENYIFQKFMRACIGTNNVDHCARLCHSSTVAGLARAFGSGAMTNSEKELLDADCIFVIGSNTTEAHPVIGIFVKQAVVNNGCKLIVADPRRIELAHYAEVYMPQRNGTDVALINGMMNVILSEGLHDEAYIAERCEGFEEVADVVKDYPPEKVAEITGVPAEDIRQAARIYARAGTASIIYSMGITQHTTGTDNVLSLANLAMMAGNVGRASTGVNPLRGQNNVQGACDLGALPNVYPGYQKVEDPEAQAKFEEAWGRSLDPKTGLTVVEIMHEIEKENVKALYIMGENPALSDPNLNRTRKALASVEFLVVQDIFLTETAEYADVVLPCCCFAEKDGTYTNTERRVQRVRKAVEPPGEARDDWRVLCDLSSRLGYPMHYEHPSEIMEEIAKVSPIYGGMFYDRIDDVGLQWPCLDRDHPGTPYLHKGTFKRGKGKFHPVPFREPAELPDESYPLILSTGRMLQHFHTGTMSRKSPAIDQIVPEAIVQINPQDAAPLGIADGDMVRVVTRRGKAHARADLTPNTPQGRIFMPFHFAEGPANILTNDALDPIAKIPEFKVCAARIAKAEPART